MYLVYGNESFLCKRFITSKMKEWAKKGYSVHKVQGISSEIEPYISPMLSLFGGSSDKTGFVVLDPLNADLPYLKEVAKSSPVLLYVEGSLPKSKKHPLHKIPKKNTFKFVTPSPFKAEAAAIDFAVSEAKAQGLALSSRLAGGLVKIIGTDFGIISYEILKISMLMGEEKEITPKHFRSVAQVSEISAAEILQALRGKQLKALLKALAAVRRTHSKDPTLLVCAWIGSEARKWLLCASLKKQKKSLETSGINPYVIKKNIIPVLKRWDQKKILNLVHCISNIERYVKTGGISSWTKMEGELAQLVSSS